MELNNLCQWSWRLDSLFVVVESLVNTRWKQQMPEDPNLQIDSRLYPSQIKAKIETRVHQNALAPGRIGEGEG